MKEGGRERDSVRREGTGLCLGTGETAVEGCRVFRSEIEVLLR